MSVFKIEKTKNFTVMSNHHLRNKNLSLKAKGMLSFMLSLPEDWDYSMNGLVAVSRENIKAIRSALKELEDNHYLIRTRIQEQSGKFNYEYKIYELPYDHFGHTLEGITQNDIQINTNIQNNNKQIDKVDKSKSTFFVPEEHNKLTLDLINLNYTYEEDIKLFFYDDLFEKLLSEGNSYQELARITYYVVAKTKERDFLDESGNLIENRYGYFKEAIESNIRVMNLDLEDLWGLDDKNDFEI